MRKMLILLAAASLAIAGACSGDDDDSATDGGSNTTAEDGGSNGGSDDGYTAEVEEAFVTNCVSSAGGVTDAQSLCQCAYDNIAATVPFEDFTAFDEAVREDPNAQPPAAIAEATTQCMTEATGGATTTTTAP